MCPGKPLQSGKIIKKLDISLIKIKLSAEIMP